MRFVGALLAVIAAGCTQLRATQEPAPRTARTPAASTGVGLGGGSVPNANPFPSTYRPVPGPVTLIRNATILTAAGPVFVVGRC